jgi:hypothetical protein
MGQNQSSFSQVPTDIAISFGTRVSIMKTPQSMRRVFIEETMQPVTMNISIINLQLATIEAEDVLRLAFLSLKHATGKETSTPDEWLRMTYDEFLEAVQAIQYVQNSKYSKQSEGNHVIEQQRFQKRRTYVNVMLSFNGSGLPKLLHRLSREFALNTDTGGKPKVLNLATEDLPDTASQQPIKLTLSWAGSDTLLFDRDQRVRVNRWKTVVTSTSEDKEEEEGNVEGQASSVSSMISAKLGGILRNPSELAARVTPALSMVSALLGSAAPSSGDDDSDFDFEEDPSAPESPSISGIKNLKSMLSLFQATDKDGEVFT